MEYGKDFGSEYAVDFSVFKIDFKGHRVDPRTHHNVSTNWIISRKGEKKHFIQGLRCYLCGKSVMLDNFNPEGENVADTTCETPANIITEVVLEIPSGKMIVTDNLIREFRLSEAFTSDYSNNSLEFKQGRVNHTLEYEKNGVLYVQTPGVPDLYLNPEGDMVFARLSEEDEDGGSWKKLASNIGDLWAFMAVDYQKYLDAGFSLDDDVYSTKKVVEVEAGTYKFTNLVEMENFDWDVYETQIYSTVEKIG